MAQNGANSRDTDFDESCRIESEYRQLECTGVERNVEDQMVAVIGDLVAVLGLVRVLTLCPIHNPGLDEVEERIVRSVDQISELRYALTRGGTR